MRTDIWYCGGTIGMKPTPQGLAPARTLPQDIAARLPEFSGSRIVWHLADPPKDSSALTPADWAQLCTEIRRRPQDCGGILILHGTDTLCYTAALLSCVFADSPVPIVLTGAQRPLVAENSDAPKNLQAALALLRTQRHGVSVVFDNTAFHPLDCRKVSTESDAGFASAFSAPLGFFADGQWQHFRQPEILPVPPALHDIGTHKIVLCTLAPGFTLSAVTRILQEKECDALILMSYGSGNAPPDKDFLAAAENFCAAGKILCNISQSWQGSVAPTYAVSQHLTRAGAVNMAHTGAEAALAKLTAALGANLNGAALRAYLQHDLWGIQAA